MPIQEDLEGNAGRQDRAIAASIAATLSNYGMGAVVMTTPKTFSRTLKNSRKASSIGSLYQKAGLSIASELAKLDCRGHTWKLSLAGVSPKKTIHLQVLRYLAQLEWPEGCCMNVNFPDFPKSETSSMVFTEQGPGLMDGLDIEKRADPRGQDYYWLNISRGAQPNPETSETSTVLKGGISVTPLQFERTSGSALSALKRVPDGSK